MPDLHRTTIYLDADLHHALRLKAAETKSNLSALINQAVRAALVEDLEDLNIMDERKAEPVRPFEDFLKSLRDGGTL